MRRYDIHKEKYDDYTGKYHIVADYIEPIYAESNEEARNEFLKLEIQKGYVYVLEDEDCTTVSTRFIVNKIYRREL